MNSSSALVVAFAMAAAPAAALWLCVRGWTALPPAMRGPWLLFAAAAGLATAGQLHLHGAAPASEATHGLLTVASLALLVLALGWLLHLRERERVLEIGLDAALLLLAAVVVTLQLSPAARAVLASDPGTFSVAEQIGILGAPIAAACAWLLACVLLVVGGGNRVVAAAITLATMAFGLAVAPTALGRGPCCPAADPASGAFIMGWLFLAYGAVQVRRLGGAALVTGTEPGGSRLRLAVAPAVVVVLAAVVIDAAVRLPMGTATAVLLAPLGALLALRLMQLLHATRSQSAERVQLAQSRMLVEVSRALSGTTELEATLKLVTYWAARLLNAEAAALELLTAEGEVELHAVEGLPAEMLNRRFPVRGSFTGWVMRTGGPRAAVQTYDERRHPAALAPLGTAPVAAAPLRYRNEVLGAISCAGRLPYTASDLELLGALADQAAVAIQNARLFEEVHQLSITDPLTGLSNRRQLERDLSREFAAARRGRRLVAVMFDLNGFKAYNDRHGHLAGDAALRLFADALHTETRTMNTAARYGGDEFIALLADADGPGTETFIERVRLRFPGPDADEHQQCLSVAAGYAEFVSGMTDPAELIEAADRALYREKAAARFPAARG